MLFVHASSAALIPVLFLTKYRRDFLLLLFLGLMLVFCLGSLSLGFFFMHCTSVTLVLREHLCCLESVLTNHTFICDK